MNHAVPTAVKPDDLAAGVDTQSNSIVGAREGDIDSGKPPMRKDKPVGPAAIVKERRYGGEHCGIGATVLNVWQCKGPVCVLGKIL